MVLIKCFGGVGVCGVLAGSLSTFGVLESNLGRQALGELLLTQPAFMFYSVAEALSISLLSADCRLGHSPLGCLPLPPDSP